MKHWIAATAGVVGWMAMAMIEAQPAEAQNAVQDLITEKRVFTLPRYTDAGRPHPQGRQVGWESYGTLNADKSNAVLICHFFSGNSHAAGKYDAKDAAPGYWDAIIGPGKAIDTTKYFVLSSDTLVNLNTGDPKTTTTGPASVNPDTGKPYALDFPVVTVGDFVNVQKALVESLGIKRAGAGRRPLDGLAPDLRMGCEPSRDGRQGDAGDRRRRGRCAAHRLARRLGRADPRRSELEQGRLLRQDTAQCRSRQALAVVTLQANHQEWANATFGRRPAKAEEDPAKALSNRFQVQSILDNAGEARAKVSDANHFLYLVKANQLFAAGGTSLADAATKIKRRFC